MILSLLTMYEVLTNFVYRDKFVQSHSIGYFILRVLTNIIYIPHLQLLFYLITFSQYIYF